MSNHVIIRLIRFVWRFTIHLCNAIYFSTTFSTPCKRFIKNFAFCVLGSKQGFCYLIFKLITSLWSLLAYSFFALCVCNFSFSWSAEAHTAAEVKLQHSSRWRRKKNKREKREKGIEDERNERERGQVGARVNWYFCPSFQLKIVSLFNVMCCGPNNSFTMC